MRCTIPSVLVAAALSLTALSPLAGAETPSPVEQTYNAVRADPVRLGLFLRTFPKGADLHIHLSGAIYAENMLDWAAKDGLCVSLKTLDILDHACPHAKGDEMPASALVGNEKATNQMIDAMSMRDFVPAASDRSGHDHFFTSFRHFDAIEKDHQGDMLAEAMDRAAADHITYIEPMVSPALGSMIGAGFRHPIRDEDFAAAHQVLKADLPALVAEARRQTDAMEHKAQTILQCGTTKAHPGCGVSVHYLFQTLRILPPQAVYAQLDAGYAVVKADPRFVGVNIVAPEDDTVAMRDYSLHMRMFRFLSQVYPGVNLSLHAGELTGKLVPPEGLKHHIREAIEIAGAKRIGHGVDIASEDDVAGLLAEMAKKHVMVEINLTSNDEILNVKGAEHPLPLYRRAGVPVALSTDDEGVSRGDLTQEYVRAARTYNLSYGDLKQMSRTGLEYAFIPGQSLWENHQVGKPVAACQTFSASQPESGACADLLKASEKARLQWQLESRFAAFETSAPHESLYQ
ncbi:adenosine deaminase [Gluconobacter frateurii M-2]|nr:adenosine deaminase [Gluconobacter frateurii M-2]